MIPSIDYSNRENLTLEEQLLYESKAMAQYAFTNGLNVPSSLAVELENVVELYVRQKENGKSKPGEHELYIRNLVKIHNRFVHIISPVKPHTVAVLASDSAEGSIWRFLGPVSLIRKMMFIALVSLVGLFLISLNQDVDGEAKNFSLFTNWGFSLFVNELFLLFAASIGASFFALFTANKFIKDDSFEPKYESSYWIRYVLGILAGVIIATLVPIEDYEPDNFKGFGKPVLALIGGFSAQVVYRIISRLTETLESLFKGDSKDIARAKESINNAIANEKATKEKITVYSKLSKLQNKLNTNGDKVSIHNELEKIKDEIVNHASIDDDIPQIKTENEKSITN